METFFVRSYPPQKHLYAQIIATIGLIISVPSYFYPFGAQKDFQDFHRKTMLPITKMYFSVHFNSHRVKQAIIKICIYVHCTIESITPLQALKYE